MSTKQSFLDALKTKKVLVADGATGTNLQARGLARGKPGEVWLAEKPAEINRLHADFINAGSDVILTCTFGASKIRLAQEGLAGQVESLNLRAVELARQAAGDRQVFVGGSIGPTGQLLKPLGPLDEEEAYEAFFTQAKILVGAGVDLLVVETQYDLGEAGLALRAVREASKEIPLVCSFSYDRGVRTMMGVKPTQMAKQMAELGADVLGINCGRNLDENLKALQELAAATTLPIWFKPNAGLPHVDENDVSVYDISPAEMGAQVPAWLAAGARVVGGCCGTSPEHLAEIARAAKSA